jgi:ABC-type nitrate/sulfonate/bicarbonate transport system substrate-binding protein
MVRLALIACWLVLVSFIAVDQGQAGSAPDKIKYPYSPISWNSLPWWMAKDAGHFEKNGLDVELFYEGASSVIVQAMLAGEANFGGLAGPAVVSNVINGGDVIQIAAIVKTFTVPMFAAPNIKEVAQLKGQKVAVSRFGSISHIAAQNIFQKAGVTGGSDNPIRRYPGIGGDVDVGRGRRRYGSTAAEFDAQGKRLSRARQRKAIS